MSRTRGRLRGRLLFGGHAVRSRSLGGSAGNRTAEVTFQALPGDSVTYGESFATTTSVTNTGNSMFTQVELRQLVPTGASGTASLVTSSCGAVVVGNEAVCTFEKLPSGGTITATLVWAAPHVGGGLHELPDHGRNLAHQGREADQQQRGVPVPERRVLGVASRRRRVAGDEEGRRLRDRGGSDLRRRDRQPAHERVDRGQQPRHVDGLLPVVHDPAGELRARLRVDDHRDSDAAVRRLAQGARAVGRLHRGPGSELCPRAHPGSTGVRRTRHGTSSRSSSRR